MTEQQMEEEMSSNSAPGSQEEASGIITIVLTADNHLGYTAPGQSPRKREERRQRLRSAFQQATDFAIGQGVDLFMQAGDLFDTISPDEQDRSFVAARLAQLRQAGIQTFALGGLRDTPAQGQGIPAPQVSYARLGALRYFPPHVSTPDAPLEPVIIEIRGTRVGICALGIESGTQGDPLAQVSVESEIERADLTLLLLHAPIEGLGTTPDASPAEVRGLVHRTSLEQQAIFRTILAGYHHSYRRMQVGGCEMIVAGATQHIDFNDPTEDAGFVFLGLAANGVRWCKHIAVDALQPYRLVVRTAELWPVGADAPDTAAIAPTDLIVERLRPLVNADALIHLRFEGELTRRQYHQLDLNALRRFGEEHFFALSLDDSALSFLPEQEAVSAETGERFSPREELVALADEWIAQARDEQERKALLITKEDLLAALDGVRYPASRGDL